MRACANEGVLRFTMQVRVPERNEGLDLSIIDRFLAGDIQPANVAGVLAYMGLPPAEQGSDAMNCAWAYEQAPSAAASAA